MHHKKREPHSGVEFKLKGTRPQVIRVKGVSKRYGKKDVLNNVDLDIERGDIFGLIGMSGSGKTTLLQIILGFEIPEKGDVFFLPEQLSEIADGKAIYKSVFKETREVRKMFGISAQSPSFYELLTVKENMAYFGSLYDLDEVICETNIKTILRLVGLSADGDSLAGELSGGMQKRLDIACSLMHNPQILLMDEPTADLDPVLRAQMWDLIRKINNKGTTIILASHFLDEIEQLCTKIAIINDRKIIGYGPLKELQKMFVKYEEVKFRTQSQEYTSMLKDIKKIKGVKKIRVRGKAVTVHTDNAEALMSRVISIAKKRKEIITHAEINKATLGEIFEALTAEHVE